MLEKRFGHIYVKRCGPRENGIVKPSLATFLNQEMVDWIVENGRPEVWQQALYPNKK